MFHPGDVDVTLTTGDVEIGAVEIKNSTDDTRATVGANGLYTDVRASALPTGAATETTLGLAEGHLGTIDTNSGTIAGDTTSIDGKITACNTGAVVVASGAITETNSGTIAGDTTSIDGKITACDTGAVVIASGTVTGSFTVNVPTTLTSGNKSVTTSGTAEALGTTLVIKSVYIRARGTNTGNVFIGDSTVDAVTNQGIILAANDSVTLDIADRATVYVDVAVNLEGVDYVCSG